MLKVNNARSFVSFLFVCFVVFEGGGGGGVISVWRDREHKGWRRCVVEVGGGVCSSGARYRPQAGLGLVMEGVWVGVGVGVGRAVQGACC